MYKFLYPGHLVFVTEVEIFIIFNRLYILSWVDLQRFTLLQIFIPILCGIVNSKLARHCWDNATGSGAFHGGQ